MNNSHCLERHGRHGCDLRDVHYYSSLIPRQHAILEELIAHSPRARNCFIGIERRCKCLIWASIPNDTLLRGFYLLEVLVDKDNGGNSIGSQFMIEQFFKVLKQTNNIAFNRVPYMFEKSCKDYITKRKVVDSFTQLYGVENMCEVFNKSLNLTQSIQHKFSTTIEDDRITSQNLVLNNLKTDATAIIKAAQESLEKSVPLKLHSERIPILTKIENIQNDLNNVEKYEVKLFPEKVEKEYIEDNMKLNPPIFPQLLGTADFDKFMMIFDSLDFTKLLDRNESMVTDDIIEEGLKGVKQDLKCAITSIQNMEEQFEWNKGKENYFVDIEEKQLNIEKMDYNERNCATTINIAALIEEKTESNKELKETSVNLKIIQSISFKNETINVKLYISENCESICGNLISLEDNHRSEYKHIKDVLEINVENMNVTVEIKEKENETIEVYLEKLWSSERRFSQQFENLERNVIYALIMQNYQETCNLKQTCSENEINVDSFQKFVNIKVNNLGETIMGNKIGDDEPIEKFNEKKYEEIFLKMNENFDNVFNYSENTLENEEIILVETILHKENENESLKSNNESYQFQNLEQNIGDVTVEYSENFGNEIKSSINLKETTLTEICGEKFYLLLDNHVESKRIIKNLLNLAEIRKDRATDLNTQTVGAELEAKIYGEKSYSYDSVDINVAIRLHDISLESATEQKNLEKKVFSAVFLTEYLHRNMSLKTEIIHETETITQNKVYEKEDISKDVIVIKANLVVDNFAWDEINWGNPVFPVNIYITESKNIKTIPKLDEIRDPCLKNIAINEKGEEFNIVTLKLKTHDKTKVGNTLTSDTNDTNSKGNNEVKEIFDNAKLGEVNMFQEDVTHYLPSKYLFVAENTVPKISGNETLLKATASKTEILSSINRRNEKLKDNEFNRTSRERILKNTENEALKMKLKLEFKNTADHMFDKNREKLTCKTNHWERNRSNNRRVYKGSTLDKLITDCLIRCKDVKSSNRNRIKREMKNFDDKLPPKKSRNRKVEEMITYQTKNNRRNMHRNHRSITKPLKKVSLFTKYGEKFTHSRGTDVIYVDKSNHDSKINEDCEPLKLGCQYFSINPTTICNNILENKPKPWVIYNTRQPALNSSIVEEVILEKCKDDEDLIQEPTSLPIISSNQDSSIVEDIMNSNNINNNVTLQKVLEKEENKSISNSFNKSYNNVYDYEPLVMDYYKTNTTDYIKLDLLHCWESKNLAIQIKDNYKVELSLLKDNQSIKSLNHSTGSFSMSSGKLGINVNKIKENDMEMGNEVLITVEEFTDEFMKSENIWKKYLNDATLSDKSKMVDESIKDNVVQVSVYDDDLGTEDVIMKSKKNKYFKYEINQNIQEVMVKLNSSHSSIEKIKINSELPKAQKKTLKDVKNEKSPQKAQMSTFTKKFVDFPNNGWTSCFDFVLKQVMLTGHFTS